MLLIYMIPSTLLAARLRRLAFRFAARYHDRPRIRAARSLLNLRR